MMKLMMERQFGLSIINFLGHRVTKSGAAPLPLKVEAVAQFLRPLTVKSLQEFLDMVNLTGSCWASTSPSGISVPC